MEEIYEEIEKKLEEAGYHGDISGYDIYDDVSNLIDNLENGEYTLKSEELGGADDSITYVVEVLDSEFDLKEIAMVIEGEEYHVDLS
jgi:hypothetical protein